MKISIERVFSCAWKLAIIFLPWQTRWFTDASLVGWPWEEGRISMYLSWLPLLIAVVLGLLLPKVKKSSVFPKWFFLFPLSLFLISIGATHFDGLALQAVLQWWLHIFLLGSFIFVLVRREVAWKKVATWFVISLLPHVALGLIQFATQTVWGSKFLGIATQLPENPGVSVVEHGAYRVLRVYGGFPHPNVFGGWLALGLIVSLLLAAQAETKRRLFGYALSATGISLALLLTYSRSSWLAAGTGFILLSIYLIRRKLFGQFFLMASIVSILVTGIVGFTQRDHILARAETSSRLEAQSLSQREQSIVAGWSVFQDYKWFGTGPNAELYRLGQRINAEKSGMPLEPPHNIFILGLIEFGIVGSIVLLLFGGVIVVYTWKKTDVLLVLVFLTPLICISFFDHYLWSYWAGQSLVAIAIFLGTQRKPAA